MTYMIRDAKPEDAAALAAIYAPYVEDTAITFDLKAPDAATFKERIAHTQKRYPYLVLVVNDQVLGYAYASPLKDRGAYNHSAELSIYIDQKYLGKGFGSKLYDELERRLLIQGITNLYACITLAPTDAAHAFVPSQSIAFHERRGFERVAHFHRCGLKFSTYFDVIWCEKICSA